MRPSAPRSSLSKRRVAQGHAHRRAGHRCPVECSELSDPKFLGKECERDGPWYGVDGGTVACMKVFCTMKPRSPNVDGVNMMGTGATTLWPAGAASAQWYAAGHGPVPPSSHSVLGAAVPKCPPGAMLEAAADAAASSGSSGGWEGWPPQVSSGVPIVALHASSLTPSKYRGLPLSCFRASRLPLNDPRSVGKECARMDVGDGVGGNTFWVPPPFDSSFVVVIVVEDVAPAAAAGCAAGCGGCGVAMSSGLSGLIHRARLRRELLLGRPASALPLLCEGRLSARLMGVELSAFDEGTMT
mmetsp:Transcript_49586/g.132681  ORF Transcript_49586/g.132681 Transcript_49586/m.132681 type:complete len:299 (+) Transcript_49586:360-1256(+)